MNTFTTIFVVAGLVIVIWKFFDYRKKVHEVRNQPGSGYGKRMGVFYLLSAFMLMFGLGAVLEKYLLRILNLKSSSDAEIYMLAAFIVLAIAAVLILSDIKITGFRFFNKNEINFKGDGNMVNQDIRKQDNTSNEDSPSS